LSKDNFNINNIEEDESLVWQNAFKEQRQLLDLAMDFKIKFESDLSVEDIQNILYKLNEEKYSILDFIEGRADEEICNIIYAREAYLRSLKFKEEDKRRALEVKKEKMLKQAVAVVLAGAIAIGGAYAAIKGINHNIEKNQDAEDVNKNIGMLASMQLEDEGLNIVEQSTKILGYKDNVPSTVIDLDIMANKIMQVCENDHELFDVTIANIYFDIEYARLSHMDRLFKILETLTKDKEEYKYIYDKVSNAEVFLDYLINENIISKDNPKYEEVLNIIQRYKDLKVYNREIAFEVLESKDQYIITQYLINNYRNFKYDENYKQGMYIDDLVDKIFEEGVGGRNSGS